MRATPSEQVPRGDPASCPQRPLPERADEKSPGGTPWITGRRSTTCNEPHVCQPLRQTPSMRRYSLVTAEEAPLRLGYFASLRNIVSSPSLIRRQRPHLENDPAPTSPLKLPLRRTSGMVPRWAEMYYPPKADRNEMLSVKHARKRLACPPNLIQLLNTIG